MKYRIYDKINNEYPEQGKFLLDILGILHIFDCKNNTLKNIKDLDRYVVEMSTGLKDKNGVEIYEGDTVKKHYEKHDITFEDGSFFLFGYPIREQKAYGFYKELEIIGNIHEAEQL